MGAIFSFWFFYFEAALDLSGKIILWMGADQLGTWIATSNLLPLALFIIWTIIWLGILIVCTRAEPRIIKLDRYLWIVSLILLVLISGEVVRKNYTSEKFQRELKPLLIDNPSLEGYPPQEDNQALPDNYYLILDGFAGPEILEEKYDTNSEDFIHQLEERGFYAAVESRSNYSLTITSLPSSLNINYWDELASEEIKEFGWTTIEPLLLDSLVSRYLDQSGYQLLTFQSGFWPTEDVRSDTKLRSLFTLNEYQVHLVSLTPLPRFFPDLLYENHRSRVKFALRALSASETSESPRFIIAHILAPHPPFVFDKEGSSIRPQRAYSYADAEEFRRAGGTPEEYQKLYAGQVDYLMGRILEVIDEILQDSGPAPIIIIQGDHGLGSRVDLEEFDSSTLDERFSILNAYYFPDEEYGALYPTISPVNTFRVIFNQYFDQDLALLPDRSYFSTVFHPFDFIDVTGMIR